MNFSRLPGPWFVWTLLIGSFCVHTSWILKPGVIQHLLHVQQKTTHVLYARHVCILERRRNQMPVMVKQVDCQIRNKGNGLGYMVTIIQSCPAWLNTRAHFLLRTVQIFMMRVLSWHWHAQGLPQIVIPYASSGNAIRICMLYIIKVFQPNHAGIDYIHNSTLRNTLMVDQFMQHNQINGTVSEKIHPLLFLWWHKNCLTLESQ